MSILKTIVGVLLCAVLFVAVIKIRNNAQIVRTLEGVKKEYLESLPFTENPKKLQRFKRSVYYKKMMAAKKSDSVRY